MLRHGWFSFRCRCARWDSASARADAQAGGLGERVPPRAWSTRRPRFPATPPVLSQLRHAVLDVFRACWCAAALAFVHSSLGSAGAAPPYVSEPVAHGPSAAAQRVLKLNQTMLAAC